MGSLCFSLGRNVMKLESTYFIYFSKLNTMLTLNLIERPIEFKLIWDLFSDTYQYEAYKKSDKGQISEHNVGY